MAGALSVTARLPSAGGWHGKGELQVGGLGGGLFGKTTAVVQDRGDRSQAWSLAVTWKGSKGMDKVSRR